MPTDAKQGDFAMTSHKSSRYGLKYALAIAVTATIAVAGFSWAKGIGQQAAAASEGTRIDVSTLLTSAEIGNLPVHDIKEAF